MVGVKTTVMRNGQPIELPLTQIVPGDIVTLSAGDIIPADLRLIESKDLYINQSALTGESIPVEKISVSLKKRRQFLSLVTYVFRQSREFWGW